MGPQRGKHAPCSERAKCYCLLLIIALDFKCIWVHGGGTNWMALTESAPSLKFTAAVNLP